jgi:hypothetical protein
VYEAYPELEGTDMVALWIEERFDTESPWRKAGADAAEGMV